MSEQEEFEFRHRLEEEQNAKKTEGLYKPGPIETGLASMAPVGLTASVQGIKEAFPKVLEGDFDSALETYRRERDMARSDLEAAQKENPRAALIGQVAPGLLIPGGGVRGAAAMAAGYGALDSKADLTKGEFGKFGKDVALNTTLGTALGGIGKFAPKATAATVAGAMAGELINPEKGAAPGAAVGLGLYGAGKVAMNPAVRNYLLKKFNNTMLDVPEWVSDKYIKNPKAINEAKPMSGVAQDIADTYGGIKESGGDLSRSATATLSDAPTGATISDTVNMLSQFDAPEAKQLAEKLNSKYQYASSDVVPNKMANSLSEKDAYEVKKVLQSIGDWKSLTPAKDKAIANMESGKINALLKSGNPEYASGMSELSKNIQTRNELGNKFGIVPDYSGNNPSGYTFTDRTMSAMNDLGRANKVDRKRILENVKNLGGDDISESVENAIGKRILEGPGTTNGSRKAVMYGNAGAGVGAAVGGYVGSMAGPVGAAAGATVGGFTGKAAGSLAGGIADKYGPKIAKNMMDINNVMTKLQSKAGGSKYAQMLQNAAAQGEKKLGTTFYLLSQSDPEFRELVKDEPSP